jgi:PhnB protein
MAVKVVFMVHKREVPPGYHSVNPYIVIVNANEFILFLQSVFGAIKIKEVKGSEGEYYAEAKIGDTCLMIEEDKNTIYQKGTYLWVYVNDVNSIYEQALIFGCRSIESPTCKYGADFVAKICDPFGIIWLISSYNSN